MEGARDITPQTLATPAYFWPVVGLIIAGLVVIGIWQRSSSPTPQQGPMLEVRS